MKLHYKVQLYLRRNIVNPDRNFEIKIHIPRLLISQGSDLALFVVNGTLFKIPSEIKPPLVVKIMHF